MVIVSREPDGRYYVTFAVQTDDPGPDPAPETGRQVGVDLGVKDFAALSTGEKTAHPRHLQRKAANLARYQRRMARKQRGSNNRRKAKRKVAAAHRKVRHVRNDFLHKTSSRLVREYDLVAVEDLNISGMTASARGTIERPGRNVRRKAGLNRSVAEAALGEFRRRLEYKAARAGRTIAAVDRWFPSSKTCSSCGHLLNKLSLGARTWVCPACRTRHDRDVNAAKNILAAGRVVAREHLGDACGAGVSRQGSFLPRSASKQETGPVRAGPQGPCARERVSAYRNPRPSGREGSQACTWGRPGPGPSVSRARTNTPFRWAYTRQGRDKKSHGERKRCLILLVFGEGLGEGTRRSIWGTAMEQDRLRVFASPDRYVQGRGALGRLGELVNGLGDDVLVVTDDVVRDLTATILEKSFEAAGVRLTFELFGGVPTSAEAERIAEVIGKGSHDVVVGLGGGAAIDTAKAAGDNAGVPWVSAATLASTDAPTSALSVVYTEEGAFEAYRFYGRNPALVVVDTEFVANAPTRFLAAGVGDALATWIEARALRGTDARNMVDGLPTRAGTTIARLSWDILWESALPALEAVEHNLVTADVEAVVEATTLLSGLGFESGGLAAAHAVHDGLTAVEETHALAHGEKVNIGSLTQLVLEGAPASEIEEFAVFTARVGLPTTLTEAGLGEADDEVLDRVVEAASAPEETIHNLPFTPSHRDVRDALKAVEGVGRSARRRAGLADPEPPRKG